MPDNFTNDTTEMLVRYMDNELTADENAIVKTMLENDEKLNEQYAFLAAAKQAVRSQGLKHQIQSIQNEFLADRSEETTQTAKVIKPASFYRSFMRIAAVFVLVVAGYGIYQYTSTTNENLFDQNYIAYQSPVNRSDVQANNISILYNAGNFRAVVDAVNNKPAKTQQDYFLAAQSYLQLNNATEAIRNFNEVEDLNSKTANKYFADETDYYLALAYIKSGNIDVAKQQLQKITSNKNHLYYNNAKNISQVKLSILKMKETN